MPTDPAPAASAARELLAKHGVKLTLGGEPTYVPDHPEGPEWSITALGPTKLRYGYALAAALKRESLKHAVDFYCPGKSYPGELNPRWAITLVWRRDGTPLVPSLEGLRAIHTPNSEAIAKLRAKILTGVGLEDGWLKAIDPFEPTREVWVLPLDHENGAFVSAEWDLGAEITLLRTEGPAGLRLPLHEITSEVSRRALTVELVDEQVHIFLPPFLQAGFLLTLEACAAGLRATGLGPARFASYLPDDEANQWTKLGIASDPGVLEINLPPCHDWTEYRDWLALLESAASRSGLRSCKQVGEDLLGTGGGNHILFGGPSLDEHPLFPRPAWVTSILRYWQHHPSLAYLFTGQYVGASSQAPRPDEGALAIYDLEMAYRFLEELPPGDHRYLISETLRHLHTDSSGNTHRSEISFDKFWNVNFPGGCRGLIEFRAIESCPRAEWMSAIALLWYSLAAYLLEHPFTEPLVEHGDALHDRFFLPSGLIADFDRVLTDLRSAGIDLPFEIFREIIDWRFPVMLHSSTGLTIRKALEGWPLLCETPLEGGSTSRFVDTSIERLEFSVPADRADSVHVYAQGRELPLSSSLAPATLGAGLRYRRTALYPCLHPGIPIMLPLFVVIESKGKTEAWRLDAHSRKFVECPASEAPPTAKPCHKLREDLLTFDLRLT